MIVENWLNVLNKENTELHSICQDACSAFVISHQFLRELAKYGRDSLLSNLTPDELQVFRNARLLEKLPNENAIKWWDKLKLQARKDLDEALLAQGRLAESWTIQRETEYIRSFDSELVPEWVAMDGDHYGYDVLSYRLSAEGTSLPIQIEVKSFAKIKSPHFYLTVYEWSQAVKATPNYIFYIWCIETREYKILTLDEILPNIPLNNMNGEWQNVYISLDW